MARNRAVFVRDRKTVPVREMLEFLLNTTVKDNRLWRIDRTVMNRSPKSLTRRYPVYNILLNIPGHVIFDPLQTVNKPAKRRQRLRIYYYKN